MRIAALAVLGSVFLLGCQPSVSIPTGPSFGSVPFRCPNDGTVVTWVSGRTARYAGVDPADPVTCIVRTTSGDQRWLYNLWRLPLSDEQSVRRGLTNFWPLEAGKEVRFSYLGSNGQLYMEHWRAVRAERIRVGEQERNTILIARTQEGMGSNYFSGTFFIWIDTDTGADLKRVDTVLRGNATSGGYEAASIRTPLPPTR